MPATWESAERARYRIDDFLGISSATLRVKEQAARAARTDLTVLLLGESGTGKEILAHAIHGASERRAGPFVAVNCAAIPRTLLESELFGYTGGAFTGAARSGRAGKFEAAHGGTLFLDEIGDMPPEMQSTLLRVLNDHVVMRIGGNQGRRIDVRIIAATNTDLAEAVRTGRFRSDLYYRLDVLTVRIPPLRQRPEDIPVLAEALLERRGAAGALTRAAMQALCDYDWPGNVRELENVLEKCLAIRGRGPIDAGDLPPAVRGGPPTPDAPAVAPIDEVKRQAILAACRESGYNLSGAARMLGISRPTLYRSLRRYGIAVPRQGRTKP